MSALVSKSEGRARGASMRASAVAEAREIILPSVQAALADHAEFIRQFMRVTLRDAIEVGRRLTEVKEWCGHGNWLTWLDREFEWDERTARRFMNVYELSLKSDTLADLSLQIPLAAAYALSAPSTPVEAQQAVIAAAESGQKVTVAKVKEAIAEARDDHPPPRRHPQAEIITPSVSAQLVANAQEHLDAIVSLMGKMSQHDRASFQQTAMERLGGDQ
jgi:hypothetical protein